ncbi:hypothetical protein CHS0354_021384 [Potamilus streckersoni]|uniref:Acyltransferase n=1 Tax=Potamilus streckersoni TaxID=2493646 RepID=A0AAE0S1N6_9BIVA|nr:hypothetical protein CHS0354_021384 [Potamilus streckersoni]
MKIFGVEFAPLNIPLQRRLQTLAVFQHILSFLFLGFGCLFLCIYLLLFTHYYHFPLACLVWYLYDRKTSARGGRRNEWVRRWKLWEYFRDYFPMKLVKTADLDPKRNYILGIHPHGIFSCSAFLNFSTEATGWSKKFPGTTPHLLVLAGHFKFPIYRDYFMLSGVAEVTKDSMDYLLSQEEGGRCLGVVVGGAVEALEAHPGKYNLCISKKKGFIKMALIHGAPLVPVFSFGETDLYDQVNNPDGSLLKNLQMFLTKRFGFSPPIFYGRGVFNYTFGIMPYRHPVTTVVGKPIEVEKKSKPSQEDIDDLHKKYVAALIDLFEKHKIECGVDESQHLNFVD